MSLTLSYQILSNLILILAILGVILIILRHLSEATDLQNQEANQPTVQEKLQIKGLPAQAISKTKIFIKIIVKKSWDFMLEAKDMRPTALTGYKIKKIFGQLPSSLKKPQIFRSPLTTEEVKNENFFLAAIKNDPKNLDHYDALGRFYLDTDKFSDAKDIYIYLTNHHTANSDYHARLAYSLYKLGQYNESASRYQKSVSLDSTQPNRYYNLGLALDAAGLPKEALSALEQASVMEPANSKFYIALNNAYLKLGQPSLPPLETAEAQNGEDIKVKVGHKN